ncbi:hypothetical protein OIU76_021134 [Salix suchowensis]|nr:hypothetical protein OIU76_021134 [Salix suchowensis]
MRAGGCIVQQALTAEAASVIKQAVTLARRRGHAQVTPLHVANTMLSASTGLLRTACLQSHSHPLQCKALELCFNVALNRLPTSTSNPMICTPSRQFPSISNALVAAFKRAQAHQRRGSIENQQQPLLAVKIALEQLMISILDDPSVSRVMREAGFSSTQVKSNVEQSVSLEISPQSAPSVSSMSKENNIRSVLPESAVPSSQVGAKAAVLDPIRNEDVMCVIENLMNRRRRNLVIVGESLESLEVLVKGVMDKVQNGDVTEGLREVKFLTIPVSSFGNFSRVEVEHKLEELKLHVKSYMGKGVVLHLGDLKWVIENRAGSSSGHEQERCYFCPMEYLIIELGKFACAIADNNGRFWLMGVATFQTYLKCKSDNPSADTVLGLHPLTIPAGSLRLSLISDSDLLTKFETEARSLPGSTCNSDSTSTLPAWLQKYKNEKREQNSADQDSLPNKFLCRKWNSFCSSMHQQNYSSEDTITFSSVSPSSSTSYDHQDPNLYRNQNDWPIVEQKQSFRDHHFWINKCSIEPSLRKYIPEHKDHTKQLPFSSNTNSTPNSTSSGDFMEMEYLHRFKELNAENLNTLCNALEKKVPWQKDIIPEIASTILQCRSGMTRRKGKVKNSEAKEETWFLFQGVDMESKEKIAKELARATAKALAQDQEPALLQSSREQMDHMKEESSAGAELMEGTSPCVSLDLNISIEDDSVEDQSIDDIGLLESVDRRIIFKIQDF